MRGGDAEAMRILDPSWKVWYDEAKASPPGQEKQEIGGVIRGRPEIDR
jgi:hypothetical protein